MKLYSNIQFLFKYQFNLFSDVLYIFCLFTNLVAVLLLVYQIKVKMKASSKFYLFL